MNTYHIDVLNLQETKLPENWDIQKELQLSDEWQVYQNVSTSRKGYAGVATISKLPLLRLPVDMPNERFQTEGRMLLFKYDNLYIINTYFPQGDRIIVRYW